MKIEKYDDCKQVREVSQEKMNEVWLKKKKIILETKNISVNKNDKEKSWLKKATCL